MKSIRLTFRLNQYQLARGLQTMRQLDPTYQLTSLNEMVKTIYHDYLAKMTIGKTLIVPQELIHEINAHLTTSTEKLTLENLFAKSKSKESSESSNANESHDEDVYDPDEELSEETLAEIEQMVNQTKNSNYFVKPASS